ncbi:hypothetical protein F5Y18DRAFT_421833 [Xylariaceae sp. FL1019]|nr:hypothetical protein F5Y18DRAFT_421833 [Xylariaceae sp. FL1019]
MAANHRWRAYSPIVAPHEELYRQQLLRQVPIDRRAELEYATVEEILTAKKESIAAWGKFCAEHPTALRLNFWHAGCRLSRPECSGRTMDPDWAPPYNLRWDQIQPAEPENPQERRLKHDLKFLEGIAECHGHVSNCDAAGLFPIDCPPAEKEDKVSYLAGKLTGDWTDSRLRALHIRRGWREFSKFLTMWGKEHLSRYHGSLYVVDNKVVAIPWRINWKADKHHYVDYPTKQGIIELEVEHDNEVTLGHLLLGLNRGLIESIDVELRAERPRLLRCFTVA